MFRRWRPDNDLVQSTQHRRTIYVTGQHWWWSHTVHRRLSILVVRSHMVVQYIVYVIAISVVGC